MPLRIEKGWISFTPESIAVVGGQLGVFQLGSSDEEIVFIGMAGGRSLFGLRGELTSMLTTSDARLFRYEVNTAYLTRYRELLMVHLADFGYLPRENKDEDAIGLGRLSPYVR